MDIKGRIEQINAARQAQGLSIQQLADMSQLSPSTVSRALSGKTDPTGYTLNAIEEALGITDKPTGEPIFAAGSIDPIAERYINTQEVRINRMRAHYNMLLAEKNRWLLLSFTINIVMIVFLCGILLFDVLHPDIGWIREQLGLGIDKFKDILIATGNLLSNFCLNIV